MAGELVAQLLPPDAFRESATGYNASHYSALAGSLRGLRLNKQDIDGYNFVFQIPASLTVSTGLTLTFVVVDNGEFAGDPGKVVRLGVTAKKLASGETASIDTGAGTEQTVNITTQSTAGQVTVATLAIANANLDSAGAGDIVAVRVRRVGSNAADTFQGSAILLGVFVKNT